MKQYVFLPIALVATLAMLLLSSCTISVKNTGEAIEAGEITDKFVFEYRTPGSPIEGVIYQEPTLQGNATMAYRKSTDSETNINLELLFNATVKGLFI